VSRDGEGRIAALKGGREEGRDEKGKRGGVTAELVWGNE